jgi:hypothetical protein
MYSTLNNYNNDSNMKTSDEKFDCPSFISPQSNNYYNYYNLPSTQNTNVEQLPFYRVNQENKIVQPPIILPDDEKKIEENFEIEKTRILTDDTKIKSPTEKPKEKRKYSAVKEISEKDLLPVLDSKFNYREICKQSILLEDHLSVKEKRCTDCCIKHFLALEALSEEAIGLDKKNELDSVMKDLPNRIRLIQQKWYSDPDKKSLECAQDLRAIRKLLMTNCFSVIFDSKKNKLKSCDGNVCSLKK